MKKSLLFVFGLLFSLGLRAEPIYITLPDGQVIVANRREEVKRPALQEYKMETYEEQAARLQANRDRIQADSDRLAQSSRELTALREQLKRRNEVEEAAASEALRKSEERFRKLLEGPSKARPQAEK